MGFILFYYALLALWVPLLWPLYRARGWTRIAVLVAVAAGLLATLHEVRLWYGTMSAIRLDIPLIAMLLLGLYGLAAGMLFVAGKRLSAVLVVLALLVTCGAMAFQWVMLGRESARLAEAFHAGNRMLFEAKFRDQETYDWTFGPFVSESSFPTGHWIAEEGSRFTRLVINAAGRAWLFYPCSDSECAYGDDSGTLRAGGSTAAKRWTAALQSRALAPLDIDVASESADRLVLSTGDQKIAFAKAPPPIRGDAGPQVLEYLGAFSGHSCKGRLVDIRQFWLWREAERLYAVALVRNVTAGREAMRIAPVLLGEGTREGAGWVFTWDLHNRSWRATVILNGPGADLVIRRQPDQAQRLRLSPKTLFRDPAVALAPLTSKADWDHWFSIVLLGHFSSGDTPDC